MHLLLPNLHKMLSRSQIDQIGVKILITNSKYVPVLYVFSKLRKGAIFLFFRNFFNRVSVAVHEICSTSFFFRKNRLRELKKYILASFEADLTKKTELSKKEKISSSRPSRIVM